MPKWSLEIFGFVYPTIKNNNHNNNKQIYTFKKIKLGNVWYFCLMSISRLIEYSFQHYPHPEALQHLNRLQLTKRPWVTERRKDLVSFLICQLLFRLGQLIIRNVRKLWKIKFFILRVLSNKQFKIQRYSTYNNIKQKTTNTSQSPLKQAQINTLSYCDGYTHWIPSSWTWSQLFICLNCHN